MQTVGPALLLETKLYVPRAARRAVQRPRLTAQLDRGAASTLLLVSAPAGFGKTTLLAEWLAQRRSRPAEPAGRPHVSWLSLDRGDNDPATFWTYVAAALQQALPGVGVTARTLLQAPRPAPTSTVLTTLLNDLAAHLHGDLVLVLDDYHLIDSPEIHDAMGFLLDHAPPGLHLVVSGRADPPLRLAGLRAGGELVEVRAADLRFTADEAVVYLNEAMQLQLTRADVAALEERTEGWIAALQLAALSIQGRVDASDFIAGFAGDSRYVVDYLVEEVLARQPPAVESFLLQTSVLDRLSGPLCDAVTGRTGGRAALEALDRGNLFVVPLDDRRRWYRYHHLFADVLRARLLDESPDAVPDLHRRASDWYERNGERAVAIEHALAAADFDRAADLVELAAPGTQRDRQEGTLRRWLEAIPDAYLRNRPVLSNAYAGSLLSTGELEGVEPRLRDAERWLDAMADGRYASGARPPEMVVQDEEAFRALPTTVAVHRAGQALGTGDRAGTITHAQRALALAGPDDHLNRGAASALIGLVSWAGGDLAAAHAGYAESMAHLQRAGHIADVLGLAITMADIRVAQGRLRDAMHTYEHALRLSAPSDGHVLRGTADMYVGMSALHRERDDLAAAAELLRRSRDLGEHLGLPQNPHRWRIAMALVRQAEGDLDGAVDLLDDAERVYAGDFSPDVRPIHALRARVLIAQGRLDEVARWSRERNLAVDDELSYLREFEHITFARLLLAQNRSQRPRGSTQPLELLQRLLRAAEDGARTGIVIELLVLQAVGHHTRGESAPALAALRRALALAEPEDYVRTFVDEMPAITAVLKHAAAGGTTGPYARRLLRAQAVPASTRRPFATGPVEPLSDRELDVLRLLASDLGGPDIARQLVVSLNTVRTHTKNIYLKLGVNSRRAAVRRATELDLLRTRR